MMTLMYISRYIVDCSMIHIYIRPSFLFIPSLDLYLQLFAVSCYSPTLNKQETYHRGHTTPIERSSGT